MNILLLTNTMKQPDDECEGRTDVVFTFAEDWSKLGHRVVIIHNEAKFPLVYYKLPRFVYSFMTRNGRMTIPSIRSREHLIREQGGIKINRAPMMKFLLHSSYFPFQYKNQVRLIKDYLSELNFVPDVVTGHWFEPQLRLVHELGRIYGAKKGFVIHGNLPRRLSKRYKNYIKEMDCLFFRSEPAKAKALEGVQRSFLPTRVSVCSSGVPDSFVDASKIRSNWLEGGVFRIVYVGRLVRCKRIDAILHAVADLKCDFNLDIIGDGLEKDNLKYISKKLGIDNRVVFHGRLPREDVQVILGHSDCFVMVSEREVFGLVYLEAMAQGCITIASEGGGVEGVIVNGINGFLSRAGDYSCLSRLLSEVSCMSKEAVSVMRMKALKTVCEFTNSKVAERYLNDIIG